MMAEFELRSITSATIFQPIEQAVSITRKYCNFRPTISIIKLDELKIGKKNDLIMSIKNTTVAKGKKFK